MQPHHAAACNMCSKIPAASLSTQHAAAAATQAASSVAYHAAATCKGAAKHNQMEPELPDKENQTKKNRAAQAALHSQTELPITLNPGRISQHFEKRN